jgi:hypothetical protein
VISESSVDEDANQTVDAKFEELKSCINTILETHAILRGPNSPALVYRTQKYGTAKLPRVIVDCTYDEETNNSKMWAKAVTEIYAATKQAAQWEAEVGLELFDWKYMNSSHICTPPDSDSQELKANWEEGLKYFQQICRLFENRPPMFQAMIPVGRCAAGQRAYEWRTVILFDALNTEDDTWDSIETEIRSLIPPQIGIEIRQGLGPLFCYDGAKLLQHEQWEFESVRAKYTRPPRPGCGIGIRGISGAGTMGGYVVTEKADTKERTIFGVTNAQVALGSKLDL